MFCLFIHFILSAYFPFKSPVILGTTENWVTDVAEYAQNGVVFIMFLKKGNGLCKTLYPEFQKAANSSKGMVKFVSVDIISDPKLAHLFTVRAVPAFRILTQKGQMEYTDEKDASSFIQATWKLIPDNSLLVNSSWGPSPTTPLSAIMISNKQYVPPFWAAISNTYLNSELNDKNDNSYFPKVRIGFSSVSKLQQLFGVREPTSILFILGENISVYEGPHTYQDVKNALETFISNPIPHASTAPLVTEISTKKAFKNYCYNSGRFCIINNLDSKDDKRFLDLAEKSKNSPFRFMKCGTKCPFKGMKSGIFLFHMKRPQGLKINDLNQINDAMDRVIDGGAHWKSLIDLFEESSETDSNL